MGQQAVFDRPDSTAATGRRLRRWCVAVVLGVVNPLVLGAQGLTRPVALDVKSRAAEKADLAATKTGTLACLRRTGWARITEVGEDYSVLLTQYRREADAGGVRVSLVVELRTPAMLRSGTLLGSRPIVVWLPTDLAPAPAGSLASVVRQELERESDEFRREAAVVGERVADAVRELVAAAGDRWRRVP
jgi:hypothetical protein